MCRTEKFRGWTHILYVFMENDTNLTNCGNGPSPSLQVTPHFYFVGGRQKTV